MNIKKYIINSFRKPRRIPMNILYRMPCIANRISDEKYLKIIYRCTMGEKLDLENPRGFNEKLQWLKLYDRKEIYTKMVDKCDAKLYVKDIIGGDCIIPTLGVWDKFDQIDFDKLPNKFVLKCTHDSGRVIICKDKEKLNVEKVKKIINKGLASDFYSTGREWPYKNVKRRIIAEKYMKDELEKGLTDYKFYCFNGEPLYLYVSNGLENHTTAKISFFDMEFKDAKFSRSDFLKHTEKPEKPHNFDEMKDIARKLSKGHTFLRVDLYEINGKIYFSELTFTPCSGLMPFTPKEYDMILGNMLVLPKKI